MKHPYSEAPAYRRWRSAIAGVVPNRIDPVVDFPFTLSATDRIMTAGSCFAQHIARHLSTRGFHFLETESAHPLLSHTTAQAHSYGIYTARYGNIYTGRQLLQLLRRAYGRLVPVEDVWQRQGHFYDPFRPAIQPDGFASMEEYQADRQQHFAAVRQAFETLDCLVFTLGLTETWHSRQDGAVFPVCPGTVAGEFDPLLHAFSNHSVDEVVADMHAFITELRDINPKATLILSVSPVPLAATAEDRHVLVATAYSKAVLRVAADTLARISGVIYFPAYEIITGAFSRGGYFADDLRSIREEGVCHVMDVFFRHFTTATTELIQAGETQVDRFLPQMRAAMDTLCDESQLDPANN